MILGIDVEVVGDWAVPVATLVMAGFTAWLAFSTKRTVDVATASRNASIRPTLVFWARHGGAALYRGLSGTSIEIDLFFRNEGPGIAVVTEAWLEVEGKKHPVDRPGGVIKVDDKQRISFGAKGGKFDGLSRVSAWVRYRDLEGLQVYHTKVLLELPPTNAGTPLANPLTLSFYQDDTTKPIAETAGLPHPD